jgi:hypothetical protein
MRLHGNQRGQTLAPSKSGIGFHAEPVDVLQKPEPENCSAKPSPTTCATAAGFPNSLAASLS